MRWKWPPRLRSKCADGMRVLLYIFLVGLSVVTPWYLVLPLWCVYAARYTAAYELVLLGVLLDSYFGAPGVAPLYTLAGAGIAAAAEFLKPRIRWYARE